MKLSIGFLAILLMAGTYAVTQQATAPATQSPSAPAVDPKLHASVLEFVQVTDLRSNMIVAQRKELPAAKAKMLEMVPGMSDQFFEEWSKRMLADPQVDEYVAAIVAIYEKHFTADEMSELTQATRDSNDHKTPTVSESLKAKLQKDSIAVQSEIIGVCSQIGARQGGDIGQQIAKEHPEWIKEVPASNDKAPKP